MISCRLLRIEFNTRRLLDAMDRAKRRVLRRFGYAVREKALESISEAPLDTHAAAGQPPYSHAGARWTARAAKSHAAGKSIPGRGFAGIRYILYSVIGAESVIIGPASNRNRAITIAEILEEGKLGIDARPFMRPAYQQTLPALPGMWANSVKS